MQKTNQKLLVAIVTCAISLIVFLLVFFLLWNPNSPSGKPSDTGTTSNHLGSEQHLDSENSANTEDNPGTENNSSAENDSNTENNLNAGNNQNTENDSTSEPLPEKKPLTYLEQCELDYVEPPVVRTREEALEKIRQLSYYFPALHFVYKNEAQYSNSLIIALAGNPEMTDFAYGYLFREPVVTGGFTEDEIPENYPLFLQWDIRWGYMPYGNTGGNMGSSGCGPVCLSMAAFYLTGNRECTPDVIAQYSMDNGYYVAGAGTAWTLLTDYPRSLGLTSSTIGKSESRLKAELDKGNILICSVRPGDFTSGGHFIVIYGYDEEGFKVNDPKCVYRSRLTWTYEQIKDDIKQTWSIGK